MLDRGWTGHEYFAAVHLVHMNGRMYDTDLRRFLSPDNYVQDPSNTQNYNRYQYGYNNPLKYSDPSGEFFFLAAVIIGAIVGAASYAVNAAITGKWSWGGFFKAIVMGGVSGAISFGIGSWTASMKGILSTVVNISAHAVASGAQSLVQGGKFLSGALAGGISAGIAKGVSALTSAAKRMSTFVKSAITTAAGGVSGGIGSVLGGGKFIDGFRQGVITAGLNHAAHLALKGLENARQKGPPEWDLDGDGKLSLKEANNWYRKGGGKGITVAADSVDLDFINPDNWKIGEEHAIQTLLQSSSGLVYGQLTLKYEGNNQFSIAPDTYNFEMHTGTSFGTRFRNFATRIGHMVAGAGTPFKINFSGNNTVRYRVPSTQRPQGWF